MKFEKKIKKRILFVSFLFVLLSGCADEPQTAKTEVDKTSQSLAPLKPSSIDLSKLPSLPTTLPAQIASSQPATVLPESRAESLPESNTFVSPSSTQLSIYERLKNAPQSW